MSGQNLPPEVIKWLQSLELTWPIKHPKWDISNGYAIAEILSFYFSKEIEMHNYINGTALEIKQKNWGLLRTFMQKHAIKIPESIIKATIHTKDGGAELFLSSLYQILTNKRVRRLETDKPPLDFTDAAYQTSLPVLARTTATQTIKNNIKCMEPVDEPNELTNQRKAQELLTLHLHRRIAERVEDPARFLVQPTLADRAVRKHPPVFRGSASASGINASMLGSGTGSVPAAQLASEAGAQQDRERTGSVTDIQVHQPAKPVNAGAN